MKKLVACLMFASLVTVVSAPAQEHQHDAAPKKAAETKAPAKELKPPADWKLRLDKPLAPGKEPLSFVEMAPGWHVTTNSSAAILYHPARSAKGSFTIESEMFLFSTEHIHEGYGVIFGGSDLEGPNQAYIYFLLRGDGQFIVKRRAGDATETLVPWTPSTVILPMKPDANVKNALKVVVGAETIDFFANGEKLTSLARKGIVTDGVVGLRINHGINIHVSSLKLDGK
ncbi:MAG: hypothetical protein HYX26_07925 [Acidobacteriales bacterium]|nr:hypothetical protein [Terriglobales bacterium]